MISWFKMPTSYEKIPEHMQVREYVLKHISYNAQ